MVTRLGAYGGPRGLYGSFAGKAEQVIVATAIQGGASSKKRRRSKYPRRISIDGVLYWVDSAAEERRLLAEYAQRMQEEALIAALDDSPPQEVAKARVKVVKAARRLEQVDTREADWLEHLRQEDEELVALVLH